MKHIYKIFILFLFFIVLKSTDLIAQIQPPQITSNIQKQVVKNITNKTTSEVNNKISKKLTQDSLQLLADSLKNQTQKIVKSVKDFQKVASENIQTNSFQTPSKINELITNTTKNNIDPKITNNITLVQDSLKLLTDSIKNKVQKVSNPINKTYKVINSIQENTTNLNSMLNSQIEDIVPNVGVSKLKKIWDRTTYSLDLAFGSTDASSLIRLVPAMGVRVTKFYTIGIGFPMQHTNIGREVNKKSFEDFMYGIKLYHRLNLPKGLYFQLDNDFLNSKFSENQVREWMPAMWTGFGYNLKVAKNFGISTMVMYNALHKEQYTPYSLPLDIRVGFNWYQPTKPIFGNAKKLQQEIK